MIGFFTEIFADGREKPIKTLDTFTNGNKTVMLIDCLDFLAGQGGFFSHESLEDALLFMRDEEPEHGTAEALKIVKVIESFKAEER